MPKAKTRKDEAAEPGSDIVMDEVPTSHQPESRDGMSVDDDDANEEGGDLDMDENEEEEEEEEEVQRVRIVGQLLHTTPSCPLLGRRVFGVNHEIAPWVNAYCRFLRVS